MDATSEVSSFLNSIYQGFPRQASPIVSTILMISVILSIVFLMAPPRFVALLAVTGLILLGALVVIAPKHSIILIAISCGLLGLLWFRRRLTFMQKQLDELGRAFAALTSAENRRLLRSLNSPPTDGFLQQRDAPSIVSSEQSDRKIESSGLHILKQDRT